MTDLAPHLTAFLRDYLLNERHFSRHTVKSYTECFRLLVLYAAEQTKTRPCALKIEDFTVALLVAFLESLEKDRNNSVGTRNNRLAAIKAFFRYLEYRVPSCLDLSLQVRAIPQKRADKPLIDWLDRTEMQAILDAPDTATVAGLRDRELPLWKETKAVLNEWLDVRPPVNNRYLFLNARGRAMSPDGFAYILSQHVATAMLAVPSLKTKRVTPHVIRHSTAMTILHAPGTSERSHSGSVTQISRPPKATSVPARPRNWRSLWPTRRHRSGPGPSPVRRTV